MEKKHEVEVAGLFLDMCVESIPPDEFDMLEDHILPALERARHIKVKDKDKKRVGFNSVERYECIIRDARRALAYKHPGDIHVQVNHAQTILDTIDDEGMDALNNAAMDCPGCRDRSAIRYSMTLHSCPDCNWMGEL